MATRMQQRRGTASQWTSANPILNAGEMGWESDTNKFKIGDGTNHWASLDYFIDQSSTVNPSFGTSIIFEGATADSYETTLQVTDPTDDRTITLPNVSGTVITTGNLSDITNIGVFTSTITMEGSSADDYELTLSAGNPTDDRTITFPDATGTVQLRVTDVSDTEIGYLNGVTSAIQTQIDAKAPLNSPTFTGTVTLPANTISQSMMGDDSVGTNEIGGSAVTEAKIADGAVTSAKIANGTIVNEDINASAAIALSKLATDPLARANHTGTQTASTISDFDTQVRTSKVTDLAAPTGSFSMNSQKITNLGAPSASTDAATVAYVDAATAGLNVHGSVKAATTENITLATAVENGDTLDGVTLATGNRILVKNQTTKTENGVYVVAASGAPSRADDYNSTPEVDAGDFIYVEAGTANNKTGWIQTNAITTIGSDDIEFTQFSGAGTYTAGTGLTLTGNVFSINTATTVDLSTSQSLSNKTLASAVATTALTLNATAELRLADTDSSHYVGFKAPGTVTTNRIWTLPSADGTAGQALSTDGSGNLSWATSGGGAAFSEMMLIGA
jgi:hypothetical protein